MKVIAVNGSPRPDGNTAYGLKLMCDVLEAHGIETELLQLGTKGIHGCTGCGSCRTLPGGKCIFDDPVNQHADKIAAADGVIFGAPVYYAGLAGDMKSYMDRLFFSSAKRFKYKVAAGLVAVRRSGGTVTADQFGRYFNIAGMLVAPSCYWNIIHGDQKGEAACDEEGVDVLKTVAENMAWLLQVLDETKVPLPEIPPRRKTNFVR